MDKELKRSIILDNYQNPYHKERKESNDDYIKLNSRNISCIDNLDLYIKLNNKIQNFYTWGKRNAEPKD